MKAAAAAAQGWENRGDSSSCQERRVEAGRAAPRVRQPAQRRDTLPQSPINTSVTPEAGDEPLGHR